MVSFLENTPFRITPISPIHIGNGDEGIDWSTSIADDNYLYILDFLNINLPAHVMDEIRTTSLKCKDEKGLLKLQRIYKNQKNDLIRYAHDKIPLPPKLAERFTDVLGRNTQANNPHNKGGKATINKLNVSRCVFNGKTLTLYIPGSSIKGAIRTAYLSTLAEEKHVKCKKIRKSLDEKKYLDEKGILGGAFDKDPFRLLKVEDTLASQKDLTQVFYLVNKKREETDNDASGVPQYLEAIRPFNYGAFSGSLRLQDGDGTLKPPSLEKIIAAVNKFNISMFKEQKKQLQQLSFVHQKWLEETEKLIEELINKMDKSNKLLPFPLFMLIRLGKLCTAESKTVNGANGEVLREISIGEPRARNKKTSSHGTTFWLAGDYKSNTNLLPMGWAIIELGDTKNEALQDFCSIMAEGYSFASNNAPSYNIPDDYDKATEWLEKLLNSDNSDTKEKFAEPVIKLLKKAQKWPEYYDLVDMLLENYNFGKRQGDIHDLLDNI